jgi:hypothetical protein
LRRLQAVVDGRRSGRCERRGKRGQQIGDIGQWKKFLRKDILNYFPDTDHSNGKEKASETQRNGSKEEHKTEKKRQNADSPDT